MRRPVTVSVITVTRNDLEGLRRTVQSIREQSYDAIEHVIVDGASTDGTVDFLNSLEGVSALSEPDEGIFDAMNKGLRRSTGELIVFMNSGDRFADRTTVDYVVSKVDWAATPAWGYGAMRYVDDLGLPIAGDIQAPFNLRRMELGLSFVPHQATFVSRPLAERVGEFDASFGVAADQEWVLRLAYACPPLVWIDFLTDFLAGGAHTSVGQVGRSMLYRKMRKKHDRQLAGSRFVDALAAVSIGTGWAARDLLARPFVSEEKTVL